MQIFSFFLLLSLICPIFALPTPNRLYKRTPAADDLTEYISERDFDLTELPNGDVLHRRDLEARFLDEEEQDFSERALEEDEYVEVDDRSKIGEKIKGFFRKIGNGIKAVARVAMNILPVGRTAKMAVKAGEGIAKVVESKKQH
ncbi:hypothetical protein DACRYDRAFT_25013 [Dacryopinax primogenitus]|uniref:Uncharacterized protein n=1 Tax=Dacryopinax primogenitus (strain DJM 731) TaxID=1858805 RepID=M5FNL2_DACPD|nr:uncharacterized protein DACRYDRAFT_25013 [Dacryopinax primogenitus]EJT97640.1 hypothetical protein DACRYDRAFT_25013 [Dacryopinax primogenitus]